MQNTSHILMIRPVHFGFNAQTAVNNVGWQDRMWKHRKSIAEFDAVNILRNNDVDVLVVNDTPELHTHPRFYFS